MTLSPTTSQERTKCEIYTRVMGYYRPVTHFNIGKKAEFYSRNYFKERQEENTLSPNQSFNKVYDTASCS